MLNRVASLFRRRAFNIESLTVGHTETPGVSRMTIVVDSRRRAARAASRRNLYKLVNVLRVDDITARPAVDARAGADQGGGDAATTRPQIMQLVDVFRARVVDVAPESLIIEITGTEDKIDGLLEVLRAVRRPRDGRAPARVAMARGTAQRGRRAAAAAGDAHADGADVALGSDAR